MPEQEAVQGDQTEGQQQTNQTDDNDEEQFDPAKWQVFRDNMRKSEKDLQAKLAAAERKARQLEEAGKTAEQKTAERLTALEQRVVTSDLQSALTKAGALNPAVAARLIDRKGLDPESSDYEAQVAAAVKDVKTDAPELFRNPKVGSADGGPRGNTGGAPDMNQLIRQAAGRR